jgi:carbon storage regulator
MLVLTRRKDESLIIGNEIEIIITGIYRNKVRLGISAPPAVSVHRKEIYQKLQRLPVKNFDKNAEYNK